VRKRRFRKTLKKKNVELPEIEKEVKRLLRTDNEAVHVKWEIVECEQDPNDMHDSADRNSPKTKPQASTSKGGRKAKVSDNLPVDEHHIFGEEVSDSEEEDVNVVPDIDNDDTRLSEDSRSRFSDSNSMMQTSASNSQMITDFNKTEFNSSMFEEEAHTSSQHIDDESNDFMSSSKESSQIELLRRELQDLRMSQAQIDQEIQTIDNKKLKERLQEDLEEIMESIVTKELELRLLLSEEQ
jgi:transcription initiation factor TFIID subunit 7